MMICLGEWLIEKSNFFGGRDLKYTVGGWIDRRRGGLPPADEEWDELPTHPGIPYHQYLASDAWREKREYMLRRAGHRCQVCNAQTRLDIHHRTYKRFGEEHPDDLLALCRSCHDLFQQQGKIPSTT